MKLERSPAVQLSNLSSVIKGPLCVWKSMNTMVVSENGHKICLKAVMTCPSMVQVGPVSDHAIHSRTTAEPKWEPSEIDKFLRG
jgi:hypothetical protein